MKKIYLAALLTLPFISYGQKVIFDESQGGSRYVSTSDIVINSKYSKVPPKINGNIFFGPLRRTNSLTFYFPVESMAVFNKGDKATFVLANDETVKAEYFGERKLVGIGRDKFSSFTVDIWDTDMKLLSDINVTGIRIKTKKDDFDFFLTDKEAEDLKKIVRFMLTIKE